MKILYTSVSGYKLQGVILLNVKQGVIAKGKAVWNLFRRRVYLSVGLLMIGMGLAFVAVGSAQIYEANQSRIISLKMEDIGELVTQVAYFTEVMDDAKAREVFGLTVPFTQSVYIYSYDGVIKAGVDFTKLKYTVNSNKKVICFVEPEAYITDVDLDENSLVVYHEQKNIFTPLKLEDMQEARQKMEADAMEKAVANGLLIEATENAKALIEAFMRSNDELKDYEFEWVNKE